MSACWSSCGSARRPRPAARSCGSGSPSSIPSPTPGAGKAGGPAIAACARTCSTGGGSPSSITCMSSSEPGPRRCRRWPDLYIPQQVLYRCSRPPSWTARNVLVITNTLQITGDDLLRLPSVLPPPADRQQERAVHGRLHVVNDAGLQGEEMSRRQVDRQAPDVESQLAFKRLDRDGAR